MMETQIDNVLKLFSVVLLQNVFSTDPKDDLKLKQSAIEALLAWSKFKISLRHILVHHLLDPLFEFVQVPQLSTSSADVLVEVLTPGGFAAPSFQTANSLQQQNVGAVRVLLPFPS